MIALLAIAGEPSDFGQFNDTPAHNTSRRIETVCPSR